MKARHKIGLTALVLVPMVACLFHRELFTLAAKPLVFRNSVARVDRCDVVLPMSGDQVYRVAADWATQRPHRKVLVLEQLTSRVAQAGAIPTSANRAVLELRSYEVDDERIEVLPWNADRRIANWLDDNPGQSIVILIDRFTSAATRKTVDARLSPEQRIRVAIRPITDRRWNEANWWMSRSGIKAMMFASMTTLYVTFVSTTVESTPHYRNPDEYEQYCLDRIEQRQQPE